MTRLIGTQVTMKGLRLARRNCVGIVPTTLGFKL